MMKRIKINDEHVSDEALAWFLSLSPDIRGVYLQAWWECEGEPGPRDEDRRSDSDLFDEHRSDIHHVVR